jgi:hypothetical protein
MNLNKKFKQYGTLIVGLMIGGGFAFGGIASYAGLVGGGQTADDSQNQFNATLPEDNFQLESYGLSSREQLVLAGRNDVVFVTGLYETEEELDQLRQLEGVESNFNGRMYVQAVNYSDSQLFSQYGFTELPKVVVLGGAGQRGSVNIAQSVDQQSISSQACRSFRNWNDLAAYCQGL